MRIRGFSSWPSPRIAAVFCVACATLGDQPGQAGCSLDGDQWYSPTATDFRPVYARDAANRKVQTWNQYWGWIQEFYAGNLFSEGWAKQARASVAAVKSPQKQQELIVLLNDLGKQISGEWAKDNGVRKISTADLQGWNTRIVRAQRADQGNGDRLKAVLEEIRTEVKRKLERSRSRARRVAASGG